MIASPVRNELLVLAARVSGKDEASLSWLGSQLLGCPPRSLAPFEGRSTLNPDGAPLQLLVSLRATGASHRLIGDPAFYLPDPLERLQQSLEVLPSVLRASRAESMAALCKRVMTAVLPRGAEALQRYPRGMLLLASGLGSDGVAVYVGAEPGARDAWSSIAAASRAILPDPSSLLELIRAVAPSAVPLGMGVEGAQPERARLKLYWLPSSMELAARGDARFGRPPLAGFIGAMRRTGAAPPGTMVCSAAFHARDGRPMDVKVDISLSHLRGDREGQVRALDQTLAIGELGDEARARSLLAEAEPAIQAVFLGLGVSNDRMPRVNLYVAASSR